MPTKISALTAVSSVNGDELIPMVQSGTTKSGTPADMGTWIQQTQTGFTQAGTGAVAMTPQTKMRESVSVKDFGAVGDGVTNDRAAIQAAIDSLGAAGGSVLIPNGMKCVVDTDITIKENCELRGSKSPLGHITPADMADYAPAIYLNSAATIKMENAAQLSNLLVMRKSLTWNVTSAQVASQFVGTAVSIQDSTADVKISSCTILGFEYCISSGAATNVSRVRIEQVNLDGINGIYLKNSYDVTYLREVHAWPFVTVNSTPEANGAELKRSGQAIYLDGAHDWTKITDCFSYGYNRGIHIGGADSVTILSCGHDYPAGVADTSIGVLIDGDSFECRIIGGQCAAVTNGVYINTTATNGIVNITSLNVWETRTNAIAVAQGSLLLANSVLRNTGGAGIGVSTTSTATESRITNTSFRGFNIAIAGDSSTVRSFHHNCDFTGNTVIATNPFKAQVASSDPLVLDGESLVFEVTGTTNFGSVDPAAAYAGKAVTLKFVDVLTVLDGGANLYLNGNFTTSANDTLTIASDGTSWYEVARSAN